jgi:hypothetical protein
MCVSKTTHSQNNLQSQADTVFTTASIEVPQVNQTAIPIWIRLPKVGKSCLYTGLSRSTLNNLILGSNPPVRSVSLRRRHAIRGCRIILLKSLLAYIEGLAAAQDPTNSAAAHAAGEDVDTKTQTAPSVTVKKTRRKAKS